MLLIVGFLISLSIVTCPFCTKSIEKITVIQIHIKVSGSKITVDFILNIHNNNNVLTSYGQCQKTLTNLLKNVVSSKLDSLLDSILVLLLLLLF